MRSQNPESIPDIGLDRMNFCSFYNKFIRSGPVSGQVFLWTGFWDRIRSMWRTSLRVNCWHNTILSCAVDEELAIDTSPGQSLSCDSIFLPLVVCCDIATQHATLSSSDLGSLSFVRYWSPMFFPNDWVFPVVFYMQSLFNKASTSDIATARWLLVWRGKKALVWMALTTCLTVCLNSDTLSDKKKNLEPKVWFWGTRLFWGHKKNSKNILSD